MKYGKRTISRRKFLKRTAAVSISAVAAGSGNIATQVAQAAETPPTSPHGAELRGMSLPVTKPTAEGRFGFMFKNAPKHTVTVNPGSNDLILKDPLKALGKAMLEKFSEPGTHDDTINDQNNENPNERMTAGVTFLGQFIDHDITFDSTPLSVQATDPDAATSFRTPRYDLDSMYGLGPTSDRRFYNPSDLAKFLIVQRPEEPDPVNGGTIMVEDLPRNQDGTAIIADRRNDQTMIIAQLHIAMMKFHNRMVDYVRSMRVPSSAVFESARRMTRWYYQWMVIHDFLPRIIGDQLFREIYRDVIGKPPVITMRYYRPQNSKDRAFIPVEFSVAAFRFGHSIARPRYTMRDWKGVKVSAIPLFADPPPATVPPMPDEFRLNGGRPIPARLKIQWRRFFNDPAELAKNPPIYTAKRTRQMDARLSAPLHTLPPTALPDENQENLLSVRNLIRSQQMGLPSGQEVARRMGVTPLTNVELGRKYTVWLNKDTFEPLNPLPPDVTQQEGKEDDPELRSIITLDAFNNEVPLWFYILKEAELIGKTRTLGPVGGRLVAETLIGFLQRDLNSYLYLNPAWKPAAPFARVDPKTGKLSTDAYGMPIFEIYDLLYHSGAWTSRELPNW